MAEIKASRELRAIRERLKPALHGGLQLSSDEVSEFLRELSTVIELASETEEELALVQVALAARAAGKPCLRLVQGGAS